jgi:hypothetical protein
MNTIQIKGHGPAVRAATWLKDKGWKYELGLTNNNPFNAIYHISIPDNEHAMIFKLTFGEELA